MANIPPAKDKIQLEEIAEGMPVSESVLQKMGAAMNWIIANEPASIGAILCWYGGIYSFAELRGNGYVSCNGGSISGSQLSTLTGMTTAPNIRGTYIRILDYSSYVTPSYTGTDPTPNRSLGDYQGPTIESHSHTVVVTEPSVPMWKFPLETGVLDSGGDVPGITQNEVQWYTFTESTNGTAKPTMKSIVLDWVIRID